MKKQPALIQKRKGIPFLMLFVFVFANVLAQTQPAPTVYALVTTQKVLPGNIVEYEKMMKENWVPVHQLRKKNGKITNWALYKVHFAGAAEEYNYVAVSYYESFIKTEPNDNFPELMKAANPKADAAAILARMKDIRTIQRQFVYNRLDVTTPKAGAPATKFVIIDFMQSKEGMAGEYAKLESDVWKPVHQAFVDGDKKNGWAFWERVVPGGTGSNHNYVTANVYSSYAQLGSQDYEAFFKKAHPGKDIQAVSTQTGKARETVRRELWELILTL